MCVCVCVCACLCVCVYHHFLRPTPLLGCSGACTNCEECKLLLHTH